MNTPGVSYSIHVAVNAARIFAHSDNDAESILFRAKVAPELIKDAEVFQGSGQRDRESRIIAKLATRDLKAYRWEIVLAANNNDDHFFIDLGKYLAGELNSEPYDQLDRAIADLLSNDARIPAKQAVRHLRNNGHKLNEEMFRMRKSRLLCRSPKRKM
jgi:hypothetical protein